MSKRPRHFPKIHHLIPSFSRGFLRSRSRAKPPSPLLPTMADFAMETRTLLSKLRMFRFGSLVVGISNLGILLFGALLLVSIVSDCSNEVKVPFALAPFMAGVKILAMVGAGKAQHAAAETIMNRSMGESIAVDAVIRHERRVRYRRWLYWTRFGMAITGLQFLGAAYLTFIVFTNLTSKAISNACFLGQDTASKAWRHYAVISFLVFDWLVVLLQFFTGSDILRWRSFYSTHDSAWKAYYREVFDHGIREALCCLGRAKYLTVLEEDEVYSVARLLGDLVAYRASGTGHLELLAGLALLQMQRGMPIPERELVEAPPDLIQEATILHPYAEAAYTGPLLDFGRNPILFPCAWLYRQGVLTPWTRNRRPALEGDNWWRGHAAAFLRFVKLQPEALLQGRVCQTRREAAYFMVALHEERTVVITVRGTETPEDLLTDGLCRECDLSSEYLDGLVNNEHLPASTREKVMSTFPHYGHGGIVESARELFMQIDGNSDSGSGFLTSLLGEGGKCHRYKLRIVGHSLGGAVATLLGIRLYGRYHNLHVYAYGSLPCVDLVIAEACSDFVTTIVCNDEFSSRLSVNSILRLRSAAIRAVSDSSSADSAMIRSLARRILHVNSYHGNLENNNNDNALVPPANNHIMENGFTENSEIEIISNGHSSDNRIVPINIGSQNSVNFVENQSNCQISPFREVPVEPPEMFLAGTIIHIVRQQRGIFTFPLWRLWSLGGANQIPFKAYVSKREYFQDMLVTPYMFTDHLPWRCHYAMRRVLEAHNCNRRPNSDCVEEHLV
ncbi:hypothetical protein LUZ61_000573 [Rhynchospora tenuis]|uniref:Fungal lipase-like domain-containing protein n=1 Tax=Rhynchospora tenuis TaxID=198213 RepID=A0AAD6EPY6_9POAL|nr:hypothetical protein LUZ61_000573 [Rhynchospora tenuis]